MTMINLLKIRDLLREDPPNSELERSRVMEVLTVQPVKPTAKPVTKPIAGPGQYTQQVGERFYVRDGKHISHKTETQKPAIVEKPML
jgi:hypothetical protein